MKSPALKTAGKISAGRLASIRSVKGDSMTDINHLRAENEKLRAALGDIHAAAGNNHLIANIARAALEGK